MHRAACLLIALLAGCDQVWGLERGEEVDESDEDGDGFANSIGAFEGSTGRMRLARTPARYECSVYRTGNGVLGDANNVELLQSVDGRIGFSAERTQLRIRYIYIAYQPTIRL